MVRLASFVTEVYESLGGLAEICDGVLEAVAPAESALAESCRLWVGDGDPPSGMDALHLGHPLLDRALAAARAGSVLSARHFPAGQTRRQGLEALVGKALGFRNARATMGTERLAAVPVAVFHFRVTSTWDEKREELVRICIDTLNGAPYDATRLDGAWLEPGPLPDAARDGLDAAYDRARGLLVEAVRPRVEVYSREAARHCEVERARLDDYYQGLLKDLDRRVAHADEARRAALEAKKASVVRDLETRRHDLDEKFRVRVAARLCCLELVDIPRVLLPVRLQVRQLCREIVLGYDLLAHALGSVCCDGCRQPLAGVWLCGEGHLVCARCARECTACKRVACAACEAQRCGTCGVCCCPSCERACEECGQYRCGVHRGGCHERVPAPPVQAAPARRPVVSHAARTAGWTAVEAGLIPACFSDLTRKFRELDRLVADLDVEVTAGRLRQAVSIINDTLPLLTRNAGAVRERLLAVRATLFGSASTAERRLRELKETVKEPPAVESETCSCAECTRTRRHGSAARTQTPPPPASGRNGVKALAASPRATMVALTLERVFKDHPQYNVPVSAARHLLEHAAPIIDGSSGRAEGWAAALAYIAFTSTGYNVRQSDVGGWFGVSGATVSNRVGDLDAVLASAR